MFKFIIGLICGVLITLAIHHPNEAKKVANEATRLGNKGVEATKVAIARIQK